MELGPVRSPDNLMKPLEGRPKGLTFKNRVVLAPLTRGRAGPTRVPNDLMVEYYTQRSSGGLVITEATSFSPHGHGWSGSAGIETEEQCEAWKKVVDAVHDKGGLICCQLWHTGRASHSSYMPEGESIVGPSAIAIEGGYVHAEGGEHADHEVPRALELSELPGVVESYKQAAERAKRAGFDMVEVHAANGYLLDQFLQSCSNTRTDNYGGSNENRFRLLGEVLTAVSEVYDKTHVGVRFSPNGVFNGMGSEDNTETFKYSIAQCEALGIGYVHVMDGLGFGYHGKCPVFTLCDARVLFKGVLMGSTGYNKDAADGAVGSGACDMITFGRHYLDNPDLPERFRNGWPLNPTSSVATWYGGGAEGYTDHPFYQEKDGASAD